MSIPPPAPDPPIAPPPVAGKDRAAPSETRRRARSAGELLLLALGVPLVVESGLILLPGAAGGIEGMATWEIAVTAFAQNLLALALIVAFLRRGGEGLRSLGFARGRPGEEIGLGAALAVPLVIASWVLGLLMLWLFPSLHDVEVNPLLDKIRNPADLAIMLFTVIFAAGMGEELVRTFVLRRFARDLGGMAVGLLVWSAFFGLMHWPQGTDKAILIGFVGLSLGLVYAWRRNPLAAMACHATFDVAQTLVAYFAARTG